MHRTVTKRGRRPIFARAMTPVERQRRRRAKVRRERAMAAWGAFVETLPTLEDLARDLPVLDIRDLTAEEDLLD